MAVLPDKWINFQIIASTMLPVQQAQQRPRVHPLTSYSIGGAIQQLNFIELKAFETVHNQYQHLGIQFEGAIALHPSNPAFATPSRAIVLMPISKRSSISVCFNSPKHIVGALVTAPQRIQLTLFNSEDQPIVEQSAGSIRYLPPSGQVHLSFPKHYLELLAESIARAEISSSAPFILHQLFWE